MKAPYQVLEKKLECLRETQHGLAVYCEGGDFLSVEVDNLASISSGIIGADHLE